MREKVTVKVGDKFNKLTALSQRSIPNKDGHNIIWISCRCDCGSEKELRKSELTTGNTKSCGCLSHELGNGYKPLEIGFKLNSLTFLEEIRPEKIKGKKLKLIVKCRCDCGKEMRTVKKNFLTGATKSCGCLQRRRAREANIGKNCIAKGEANFNILFGTYQRSAKERNLSFSIDKEKFRDMTSSLCFYCGAPPSSIVNQPRSNGEYVYNGLDRLDNSEGYEVDNCVTCCSACNFLKGQLDKEDFLYRVKKVYEYSLAISDFEKPSN